MSQQTISIAKSDGSGVRAVLGPTNTGKTHLAIERMAAHTSGLIGLPLRLLAREVYQRLCERVGVANVALVTGEEKIVPSKANFTVATVEAMPLQTDVAFVAIDEVQLASDLERGHVFTDRILNLRGREETLLLGAETIAGPLQSLLPGIEITTRPRMSMLTYAGSKKITRLSPRSAIIAFSANEVYAIAELIRRQRGGAAIVMGSLSPRTRNAQVELYQSGEVDFLVATDAIGMGLNLDVDHVAFAQDRKFDGFQKRRLTAAEMGQIAGRAGRHLRDGTFGVTGQVPPLEDELIEAIETHIFAPVKVLTWRNRQLSFSSIDNLLASLDQPSADRALMKAPPASDILALEAMNRDLSVQDMCQSHEMVALLWDACCIPDYRKISPANHHELIHSVFSQVSEKGRLNEDWLASQITRTDRVQGDIDALSARIAQIRSWTYLSHRSHWLDDAQHWQEKTRDIEDRLSDALHKALTKRFIDRRTSQLMRKLRDNAFMEAEIKPTGDVEVEGHFVGKLSGFRFTPDTTGQSPEAKAANAAAMKVLASEIEKRAGRLAASANTDFILGSDATLRWHGEAIARLIAGEDYLRPRIILLADEQLTGAARDSVQNRVERWVSNHLANILKPLVEMGGDQTLEGLARGLGFRLIEAQGNIDRREIAEDVQGLSQDMRADLRRHGVRFGAYTIFIPALLKPAPAELLCLLWSIAQGNLEVAGRAEIIQILSSGRTSAAFDKAIDPQMYRLSGYRILGEKAVRIDILERLADLIRPPLYYKAEEGKQKPEGAVDGNGFYVTPAMLSILGATHEDMELVLKGLGYRGQARPRDEVLPVDLTLPSDTSTQGEEGLKDADAETNTSLIEMADEIAAQSGEGAASTQAESTAISEPAEPQTITVWRPAPRNNANRSGGARKQFKSGQQKPDARHSRAKGKKYTGGNSSRPKPSKKRASDTIDPDSPFAKLAALKENLKS